MLAQPPAHCQRSPWIFVVPREGLDDPGDDVARKRALHDMARRRRLARRRRHEDRPPPRGHHRERATTRREPHHEVEVLGDALTRIDRVHVAHTFGGLSPDPNRNGCPDVLIGTIDVTVFDKILFKTARGPTGAPLGCEEATKHCVAPAPVP